MTMPMTKSAVLNWLLFYAQRLRRVPALLAKRDCARPDSILYSSPSVDSLFRRGTAGQRLRTRPNF